MELSLDDDEAFSLDEVPAEAPAAAADESDDLDLGDLDSFLDEGDEAEETTEVEDVELSLDDDEAFSLDEVPAEAPAAAADESDDLDLGDLESLLDDDAGDEGTEVEDLELSLDDGDELSLEDGPVLEPVAPDTLADENLDLGDLDNLLDADEPAEVSDAEEDELSLEMEDDSEPLSLDVSDAPETTELDEEIEDLEFELDAEYEDKPVSQTTPPVEPQAVEEARTSQEDAEEELDLSDIEQMLENDTFSLADADKTEAEGTEKWVEDQDDDLGLGGEAEIDLSEIEEAIDAADSEIDGSGLLDDDDGLELDLDLEMNEPEAATEPEIEELDLELEMESAAETSPEVQEEIDSDELDLSDLDFSVEDEKVSTTSETIDGGDIELEFQIEEDAPLLEADESAALATAETATAGVSSATTEVADDTRDYALEETIATEPIKEPEPAKPVKAPKKKGTSKSLVFVLILALLGGGGYFGYDYVKKNDIQIPYLSDYINPKPKDPTGVMNLSTLEINSKFLENEKSGRLFIVTGKVRNGYTVPCKMVRLRGKLFTKGKVLAKTEYTYAGVMIPDQELASKTLVDIKKQLNSTLGAAAGIQINPGQTSPFMVVFSELPPDLDEFAIELVTATKL